MNVEIIICILSLVGTLSGSLIGAFTSSRLTNYRLEQIEKKIDEYQDIKSRVLILEENMKGVVEYVKENRNN